MAKVLIADDHAVVRAGLRQFLEEDRTITEIGDASTGREALDALRNGRWDLLILDINMPDRSGLDILSHIRAAGYNTRVLVMSGLPERQYALNVLRAGARGYLSKEGAPDELLKAVRAILDGHAAHQAGQPLLGARDRRPGRDADRPPVAHLHR